MKYQEFAPHDQLKAYVKCFYLSEYGQDAVQDRAFATGCIEIMFNLGSGKFQVGEGDNFITTPSAELWGQLIKPLTFRSLESNKMLGIRFYPHTASLFLRDPVSIFNDQITDFHAVAGLESQSLHEQLLFTKNIQEQLALLNSFLITRLAMYQKRNNKFQIVNDAILKITNEDHVDIEKTAFKYGISARYLQKLFVEFTGLPPKLFHKISRFQRSLILTGNHQESLTSIAYSCGYFDQSHFIRDFKFFTGKMPSAFDSQDASALLISK